MVSKLNREARPNVRLQDIAKLAETSVATVSMALAGNARVSAETRQRIRNLSHKVGYRPRRSLPPFLRRHAVRQQGLRFGFLALERLDSAPNASLLHALTSAAAAKAVRIEIASADPKAGPHSVVDRAVQLGKAVDGLIIMGRIGLEQLQQVRQAGIPAVMYGYPLAWGDEKDLPASIVTSDWQAMGHRATRELIDLGHRRIGFVGGTLVRGMWHDRCLDGYLLAHAHAGLRVDPQVIFVIDADKDMESTIAATNAAAAKVSNRKHAPTAYVLINAGNAARFRNGLIQAGAGLSPRNAVICGTHLAADEISIENYPCVYMDPSRIVEAALAQLRAKCTDPTSPNSIILVPFATRNLRSS